MSAFVFGRMVLAGAILCVLSNLAEANVTCEFETACPEGDGCGTGARSLTILSEMDPFDMIELNRAADPFVIYLPVNDRFELEDGGTGKVQWLANKANLSVSFATADQFHLLSLTSGGVARLSVHSERSSIVYIGRCLTG